MSNVPNDRKYTKDHEWARQQGKVVVVGVTFHAQEALGDVVYVELPKVGAAAVAGKPFGVIESTKAVSELFAPIAGKIVKINDRLVKEPTLVNQDPYGAWMIEIEPADPKAFAALMEASDYEKLTAEKG